MSELVLLVIFPADLEDGEHLQRARREELLPLPFTEPFLLASLLFPQTDPSAVDFHDRRRPRQFVSGQVLHRATARSSRCRTANNWMPNCSAIRRTVFRSRSMP